MSDDKVLPGVRYQPSNVIATYTDDYGDERAIHAPMGKNSALRRAKNADTPALRMNRAAGIMMGLRVRARRLELGLTPAQVCLRCGLTYTSPKNFLWMLETGFRKEGVRLGTLYALAIALECEIGDLLPSIAEITEAAGVQSTAFRTLEAA